MGTLSIIDMILMFLGFANAIWIGILYVLLQSVATGTKISNKVGTANEKRDKHLEKKINFE